MKVTRTGLEAAHVAGMVAAVNAQTMMLSLIACLVLAGSVPTVAETAVSNLPRDACVACHLGLDAELEPAERSFTHMGDDIHSHRGLSCADCHGGDPSAFDDEDAAMWDADFFIGVPEKPDIPAFCGKCHSDPTYMRHYDPRAKTDQASQYFTSQHGQLLRQGFEKVAACTDCHGVHGILEVDNPNSPVYPANVPATCSGCHSRADYMADFDIPTDQYQDYAASVHGIALLEQRDIGAPACNDCHGNHGAVPPEVDDIANVCGNCHINNHELFQQSHLRDVFLNAGIPFCIGCHGKHKIVAPTDESLQWSSSVCLRCHPDGGDAQVMATQFYEIINGLKHTIQSADSLMERAEQKGMEISDLLFHLEDAEKALIQTRTAIHSFNAEFVRETAAAGDTAAVLASLGAEKLLAESRFRRTGLFAASLIITFLVLLIYLKIRQIEGR